MNLSSIYDGKIFWAWVYHIQPGSEIVELLSNKLFTSKEQGLKWFKKKKKKASEWIEPELVPVIINKMKILSNIESGKPCS